MRIFDAQAPVLFIDIETVSQQAELASLSPDWQDQWAKRYHSFYSESRSIDEAYEQRAAIYAEFGKIVCISIGFKHPERPELNIGSFAQHDEKALLQQFMQWMLQLNDKYPRLQICGHNIKEFDLPYICRRSLSHRIPLCKLLDVGGLKPWQVPYLDTLELWKFGDRKHYTSLQMLALIFGLPSPKNDIDGSQVGRVYYEEKDLDRIRRYCEQDVITTARVFHCLKSLADIDDVNIRFVEL